MLTSIQEDRLLLEKISEFERIHWQIINWEQTPLRQNDPRLFIVFKAKFSIADRVSGETTKILILSTKEKRTFLAPWNPLSLYSLAIISAWLRWKIPTYLFLHQNVGVMKVLWYSNEQLPISGENTLDWTKISWNVVRNILLEKQTSIDVLSIHKLASLNNKGRLNRVPD